MCAAPFHRYFLGFCLTQFVSIREIAASLSLLLFTSPRRWRDHWQAARDTFGIAASLSDSFLSARAKA
jgi:hypothetical protein